RDRKGLRYQGGRERTAERGGGREVRLAQGGSQCGAWCHRARRVPGLAAPAHGSAQDDWRRKVSSLSIECTGTRVARSVRVAAGLSGCCEYDRRDDTRVSLNGAGMPPSYAEARDTPERAWVDWYANRSAVLCEYVRRSSDLRTLRTRTARRVLHSS